VEAVTDIVIVTRDVVEAIGDAVEKVKDAVWSNCSHSSLRYSSSSRRCS
jgi:hypothetical protein